MTTKRLQSIPTEALALIVARAGTVLSCENAGGGLNSQIAAHVRTETSDVFVKGLRADHKRLWTQQREADIVPYLDGIAPALLWRIAAAGWDLNGFEEFKGRHADYAPDSPDLPLVVDLLVRLSEIKAPLEVELRSMTDRMQSYSEKADLFSGDALLHTDWFPTNVLINDEAEARLVDWAWAATGAPWIDAALWVVWLIKAGHNPAQAEEWASRVPVFAEAPRGAVDAFAEATVNVWSEITSNEPDGWMVDMLIAARMWAASR